MPLNSSLISAILNRAHSLFQSDIEQHASQLLTIISGARILVIGAAGSIGGAFVKQLVAFCPDTLHLLDPSENNLVEVVRDLNASSQPLPKEFRTFAISMGSRGFVLFLKSQKPYDFVVNFAALKHVRSERDPFTFMRMLETNIFALQEMLVLLRSHPPKRFFSVSSDKAVNPESAMGASKAFMESILHHHAPKISCSSARFANVAFSDGSLLHGFYKRLEKRQPLSAPEDVRRYFISHEEAGQLCLIACFLGENRDVFVPLLNPHEDLKTFSDIAQLFLLHQGLKPKIFADALEARSFLSSMEYTSKEWPCCFGKSDTTGEKLVEEFASVHETVDYSRYQQIGVIHNPPFSLSDDLEKSLSLLQKIHQSDHWRRQDMIQAMQIVVPSLSHSERDKDLDQKM